MTASVRPPEAPERTPAPGRPPPRSVAARIDIDTANSEVLFLRCSQNRDERARAALVERFLPLARSLAWRYARSSAPLDDLVQVASFGLVKAIDRFDPARGLAFTSYAVPTILGELKRYFRDSGWAVHVPRGAQERAGKVEAAERLLAAQTGRSPTVGELARYLAVSEEQVLDGLEAAQAYAAVSLDAPSPTLDDPGGSYLDTIGADDHDLALVDASVTVCAAIEQLSSREQRILHLRFADDLTQTEISERIGVSQMVVSRSLRRSLQHLRELTADTDTYV